MEARASQTLEEGKGKEKKQAGERMKQSNLPQAASRIWN